MFEELAGDDAYWRSVNLREMSVVHFEAFARSTIQRIYELMAFKARRESVGGGKVSAKQLADQWRQNVTQSTSALSEPVSDSFVDTAVKVHDRVLSLQEVICELLPVEEAYGKASPFNSIGALEKLAVKCKTPELLQWCVCSIADALAQKYMSTTDFSLRALAGSKSSGKASKGLIDLFILKKALLDWVKLKFVTAHPFQESATSAIAAIKLHKDFRALCGGPGHKVDITWMGTLTESGRKLFDFIKAGLPRSDFALLPPLIPADLTVSWLALADGCQDTIFGIALDGHLKAVSGDSMSVQEIISQNPLKEVFDEILDHVQQERSKDDCGIEAADGGSTEASAAVCGDLLEVPLSMLVTVKQLEADVEDALPRWREFLEQQMSQFVKLIPEPETYTLLGDSLQETVAKDKHAGNVILWYDVKTAGEASSNANCRIPPLRTAHLKKMVQGFVKCRGSTEAGSACIS